MTEKFLQQPTLFFEFDRNLWHQIFAENYVYFENQPWGYPWTNPAGNGTIELLFPFLLKQYQKNCQLSDFKKWHNNCEKIGLCMYQESQW